jgi:tetraprenyl-beta-curcumene synthase
MGEAFAFLRAARIYWLEAFPVTRSERSVWYRRAQEIPDEVLRGDALAALKTKWGHAEGAAAFVTLAPRSHRGGLSRLTSSYQTMADYLDTVSERAADDPLANTIRLHGALVAAVGHAAPEVEDCYGLSRHRDDGGYLQFCASGCRQAITQLPSYPAVADSLDRFLDLYLQAEGLCHAIEWGRGEPSRTPFLTEEAARHPELHRGELIAAGSSTLPVLALIAAAAEPALSESDVELLSAAYHPWVSGLHILLHGLVDRGADRRSGQFNQLNHYGSMSEAAERLGLIATRAQESLLGLPRGGMHTAILAGMAGYYLARSEVWESESAEVARVTLASLGPLAKLAVLVHRLRQGALARQRRTG